MKETQTSGYTLKGLAIFLSFVCAAIIANLLISLMLGNSLDNTQWVIILVLSGAMLPGAFFLGRAISTQFIVNPISEHDTSTQEIIKVAEKTLLDLVNTLEQRNTDLNNTVGALEPFADKAKLVIAVAVGSFCIGFVCFFGLIYAAGVFGL